MGPNYGVFFLAASFLSLGACTTKGGDTGDTATTDTGNNTGDDTSGGGGDDTAAENPYTSYEGKEFFEYGYGPGAGFRNCSLEWDASGTPVSTLCEGCEFVFDVTLTYNADNSTDDGTCASLATDSTWTYAYTSDYAGYGPYALFYSSTYGAYYPFASASFDESTGEFAYVYGIKDYPYDYNGQYPGYYYTLYLSGYATVQ